MSGSRKDIRGSLQRAALELYRERGYDRTTAAEIAARAGVTERTFFRHFPDKREVLFDGEARLREILVAAIAAAPVAAGPLDMLFNAFRTIQEMLEENRPFSEPRQQVISSTAALHERELAKTASLAAALAQALETRGLDRNQAALAAAVGLATFVHAINCWFDDPAPGLGEHLDRAFGTLRNFQITAGKGNNER